MLIYGQKDKIKVGILGPGGVGGTLASIFWKNEIPVVCIGREEKVEAIRGNGLKFESKMFGSFIARPEVASFLDKEVDILFVATKATTLKSALERIDSKVTRNTAIMPILNGIEHTEILRKKFGNRVVASAISIEALSPEVGIIHHTSSFIKIRMAPDKEIVEITVRFISDFLRRVGIDTEIYETEKEVLWGKLIRLNALACTTAASGLTIGEVRSDSAWRGRLLGSVDEAVRVASKNGFVTNTNAVLKQLDELPKDLRTSMQRDVEAGRLPEIDTIPGSIVRLGEKYGIECPYITGLIQDIISRCKGLKK